MKVSGLDFKLGFRLLRRYPGLTIVGGLAMAFAIAVGASAFEVVKQVIDPKLPFDEGDRVVAIRTRDRTTGDYRDQTMRDLVSWRESLTTVEQLSAFHTLQRNLSVSGGTPEPVQLAEMSASGFRVARVAPLLGRTLVEADEHASAQPVAVISHELWQQRFAGDPNVIGHAVRIGSVNATIVGVMPESFGFPVAHRLWQPLRLDQAATSDETALNIFARLAAGATLEKAQADLTAIGVRAVERELAARQGLRPVVEPYAPSLGISFDVPPAVRPLFYAINFFFVMLLALICANVALLMFARGVTREGEIVVRNALGASRGRLVAQLFAEALVLGSLAALLGLVSAHFTLDAFHRVYEIESDGRLPFWFEPSLSPATVLYASALALIAAGVTGVLPALKMTSDKMDARLRQLAAGSGGLRFGRLWTAVIIAQVAVTVAFPAGAFFVRRSVVATQTMDVGFPAEQYLSARLELDRQNGFGAEQSAGTFAADFYAKTRELTRRLAAEPGVASVTLTDRLPRTPHPARRIELEANGGARPDTSSDYRIANASVDLNYFDALGAQVLAGRAFHSGDRNSGARVVIVNESFVQRVLGGRSPLGQRIRYVDVATDQRPWYDIVGVVKDLGMVLDAPGHPGLYHALPDNAFPIHVAVQLRQDPASFGARLRTLAASVDPGLRLHDVLPLTEVGSSMWREFDFLFKLLASLSAIALLLSLAGIYAVTSFTVARLTREIGIRVALGADVRRVVTTILARPVTHVGIGILAGGCMTGALAYGVMRDALGVKESAVIVAYAALMMGVCLLACVVPTRRALRVQPTEALRQD
jgi:predicted permease